MDDAQTVLISVIVPVYNVEDELDRCVSSLVGQTLQNVEIILVDDGSTDLSGCKCDLWAKSDNRIRVIHKENGGLSSARNAGIDIFTGLYVCFVDSDDYVEPDYLEAMMTALFCHDCGIASCGRFVHVDDNDIREEYCRKDERFFSREESIQEVLVGKTLDVSACDKLYKRELFDEIRYPHGRISEDAAIILPLLFASNGVVHVGRPLYHYCFREGSISKSKYSSSKRHAFVNCLEMMDYMSLHCPEMVHYVEAYTCRQCAGLLESIENTPGGKSVFNVDYRDYRDTLSETYSSYLRYNESTKNEFIRIAATRFHAYRLFAILRLLKKLVKK